MQKKKKNKNPCILENSLNTVYKIMKVSNAHYLIKFVKYKVKYSVNSCVDYGNIKICLTDTTILLCLILVTV